MATEGNDYHFEEIFRRYDPVITYRAMKKIGKATPDWEDVRQEAYLSLFKALDGSSFRGDCNVGTLIYVITERRIIDFLRLKYILAKRMERLILYFQAGNFSDPEELLIEKENGQILHSLIRKLQGWRQKQVMRLYLQGWMLTEISKKLGLSYGSTAECFGTAKCNLRNLYKKEILK